MSEMKYFVLCEKNCKFPALTKEQTLTAIAQAIETGEIKDVDVGFVTTLKEQNRQTGLRFWVGTTAEYNAIEEKEKGCFYILTDDTDYDDICLENEEVKKTIDDMYKTTAATYKKMDETFKEVERNLKIETGTYIGTGDYGSENQTSLTFGFIPKIVFIQRVDDGRNFGIFHYGANYATASYESNGAADHIQERIFWNEKTVSWYNATQYGGGEGQLNENGSTYTYVAMG